MEGKHYCYPFKQKQREPFHRSQYVATTTPEGASVGVPGIGHNGAMGAMGRSGVVGARPNSGSSSNGGPGRRGFVAAPGHQHAFASSGGHHGGVPASVTATSAMDSRLSGTFDSLPGERVWDPINGHGSNPYLIPNPYDGRHNAAAAGSGPSSHPTIPRATSASNALGPGNFRPVSATTLSYHHGVALAAPADPAVGGQAAPGSSLPVHQEPYQDSSQRNSYGYEQQEYPNDSPLVRPRSMVTPPAGVGSGAPVQPAGGELHPHDYIPPSTDVVGGRQRSANSIHHGGVHQHPPEGGARTPPISEHPPLAGAGAPAPLGKSEEQASPFENVEQVRDALLDSGVLMQVFNSNYELEWKYIKFLRSSLDSAPNQIMLVGLLRADAVWSDSILIVLDECDKAAMRGGLQEIDESCGQSSPPHKTILVSHLFISHENRCR